MIKSKIRRRTYEAIYRLLDRVSPLDYDCGQLCGSACCTTERKAASQEIDESNRINNTNATEFNNDSGEMGIYLLPGEDKIHSKNEDWLTWTEERAEDYDFPESWRGVVHFLRCKTPPHCPRERRPIQCRTFPLTPHLDADNELSLVYNDMYLPYNCPLIDDEMPLNEDFVKATYTVWKHLIEDPLIYDLVKADSLDREEAARELVEKLGLEKQ